MKRQEESDTWQYFITCLCFNYYYYIYIFLINSGNRQMYNCADVNHQDYTKPKPQMICSQFSSPSLVTLKFLMIWIGNTTHLKRSHISRKCHLTLFIRKEHRAHSSQCDFVTLKKPVEELTVEEFLKLQKEKQKFQIVSRDLFERHVLCLKYDMMGMQ